jgi:hypothetical protein
MAKLTRTKELWHIPKRGSVHQTIYMVHVLTWDKFIGKSWSGGKQEVLGTEMGKAGLTESGRSITHQSVRTLLANVPKYLGFVYIDNSSTPSKVVVTDVGYELIKHHAPEKIPKHKKLAEYKASGDLIETSDIFKKQMTKLIITNPQLSNDCENILVFPFRMTLKLLLELDYLDKEEIGYILFHVKSEDLLSSAIERIKNFRTLDPKKRFAEIEAYKNSEEGQLTLVKAPSAGYYMYLCFSTGLCERTVVTVNKSKESRLPALKLINKDVAKEILSSFDGAEIYDFKDKFFLWFEYFSNSKRLFPPFDIVLSTDVKEEVLVLIQKERDLVSADILSEDQSVLSFPVFKDEEYVITIYDLENGKKIYNQKKIFGLGDSDLKIKMNDQPPVSKDDELKVAKQVKEMFSNKYEGFDKDYATKLSIIQKVIGKNYFDNRRKGGRLEYLYFKLLTILKEKGVVDEVFWYGKNSRFGINEPAPGGKNGNPDVVFEIDDVVFILELTTIRGVRAQWNSSEASSVPDHFAKFKKLNPGKKVVGIFSAPSIHHQLEQNLTLNAKKEKVGMIFKPCIEFADFLSKCKRKDLNETLLKESRTQISD